MKVLVFCAVVLTGTVVHAQSKKELQAEVTKLKAEITELKKPKDVELTDKHKKASYGLGVLMATNIKTQGADSLDVEAINIAFRDVFQGKPLKIEKQEALPIVQEYMQAAMERKTAVLKAEGQSFHEGNKTKPGVVTTASGLQYKVITTGKGKAPSAASNVTVHYTGKLLDGTVFDSSVERGEPASFGVSDVIGGWTEALQLMHEGDKWELYIPQDLAYGERGAGGQIPPFSTLVFEVELIKVN